MSLIETLPLLLSFVSKDTKFVCCNGSNNCNFSTNRDNSV